MPQNANQAVVLLAEDEGLILTIARMALEREGYFVLAAENGEEALAASREFPGSIHALVADVRMPKMSGIELREQILAERPGIKVILMSAFIGESPVAECPFLRKPFRMNVLKQCLQDLLSSPAAA